MVETFFLNLDFEADDAHRIGANAAIFLKKTYGTDFVNNNLGIKINDDALTGKIDPSYLCFFDPYGLKIFADKKICHGPDTGDRIIKKLHEDVPFDYITVAAGLGTEILEKYVNICKGYDAKVIAFTVHSKISEKDALKIHGQPLNDAVYNLSEIASNAGCDAVVLEAKMLNEDRFVDLPIKKLVTGIRFEKKAGDVQARPSLVAEMADLMERIDYAAISQQYVSNPEELKKIIDALS